VAEVGCNVVILLSVYWDRCLLIYQVTDVVFFFSSRRRHTRCSRDWSSDVCSSDPAFLKDSDGGGDDPEFNPKDEQENEDIFGKR